MPRVKGATHSIKRRRKILRTVKGYRHGRSKKERQAREAVFHAGAYAFAHRRDKKNDFRKLWNVRINAAVRSYGLSYSAFMGALKKKGVMLNRKMLAELALHEPEVFKQIVEKARS